MNLIPQKTIAQLLSQASKRLEYRDAEILLAYALKRPREYVLVHNSDKVSIADWWQFCLLGKQRQRGCPLAYLTHSKEFFGLDFLVNRQVLIPRPETELVVELALLRLKDQALYHQSKSKNLKPKPVQATLIDVGTGSGCIPIAIAKTLKQLNTQTFNIFAIDNSRPALRVARKNTRRHNVEITFLHGDLLEPFLKYYRSHATDSAQIVITANLPYLTKKQFMSEPSIQCEPQSALVSDSGGLALYEELLKQIKKFVTCYRLPVAGFFEIDPAQSARMKALIAKYLPNANVEIKPDLCGRDRVACVDLA